MRRAKWQPYLYLAPAAILLLAFSIYPLFNAGYISVHADWGRPAHHFAGLQNYRELLAGGEFWNSLRVSVWYVAGTVPVALVLSFLIANLLFQKLRGLGLFRTIYFLPFVTSTVAAAMVWRWIFAPDSPGMAPRGVANTVLGWFGADPQRWLYQSKGIFTLLASGLGLDLPTWAGGPSLALVCIIIFAIWHTLGFDIVIFLAGLSAIPREMYEAADVDGANARQRLWHITLPLLSPTLFFLVVISVIRSFQTFNEIYVMTPLANRAATQNLPMLIYSKFYEGHADYGGATAVAVLLFLIVLGFTVFQMKVLASRVHY